MPDERDDLSNHKIMRPDVVYNPSLNPSKPARGGGQGLRGMILDRPFGAGRAPKRDRGAVAG